MTNVVTYDATQHSVDSVTVYQADRAEVGFILYLRFLLN